MNKNEKWSNAGTHIFYAVLACAVTASLIFIYDAIISWGFHAWDWHYHLEDVFKTINQFTSLLYILNIGLIGGYVRYFFGITRFAGMLDSADSTAIRRIRTGIILATATLAVMFIFGKISFTAISLTVLKFRLFAALLFEVMFMVAFMLMSIGYLSLKQSLTFPAKAREGASILVIAPLFLLVGNIVKVIVAHIFPLFMEARLIGEMWDPANLARFYLAGTLTACILTVIAFLLMLKGWYMIKSVPPESEAAE
jgi:hypothetical protein